MFMFCLLCTAQLLVICAVISENPKKLDFFIFYTSISPRKQCFILTQFIPFYLSG